MRVQRLARSTVGAILVASVLAALPAPAAVARLTGDMETGDFSQFSQESESNGGLSVDGDMPYDGRYAAKAEYRGGGANGYARAVWAVHWAQGDEVWYSAAFFLPAGFRAAMQEEVALMRWDNWPSHNRAADHGGIVIWGSDKRARLKVGTYAGHEDVLVGPFDLPEGRWFHLEVRQRLSERAGDALSEVYLDGAPIGGSTAPNTGGRDIERLRIGIVAVGSGVQTRALTLWFDRAGVQGRRAGPRPAPGATSAPTGPPPSAADHARSGTACGPATPWGDCEEDATWAEAVTRRAALYLPIGSRVRWPLR